MLEFFKTNWKDIMEIVISLIVGFFGGITYKSYKLKNVSKIKGNNNMVIQKGNDINGNKE